MKIFQAKKKYIESFRKKGDELILEMEQFAIENKIPANQFNLQITILKKHTSDVNEWKKEKPSLHPSKGFGIVSDLSLVSYLSDRKNNEVVLGTFDPALFLFTYYLCYKKLGSLPSRALYSRVLRRP